MKVFARGSLQSTNNESLGRRGKEKSPDSELP